MKAWDGELLDFEDIDSLNKRKEEVDAENPALLKRNEAMFAEISNLWEKVFWKSLSPVLYFVWFIELFPDHDDGYREFRQRIQARGRGNSPKIGNGGEDPCLPTWESKEND